MDSNVIGNLDSLPDEEKQRMSSIMEQLQTRDSLRLYNALVESCFNECVNSFWRKSLSKQEGDCVRSCAEKFLKHSMRVGLRFSELNNDDTASQQPGVGAL